MKQMDNDGNYIDMRDDSATPPATPPPPTGNSNGPSPYGYHDPRPPRRRRPRIIIPILAVALIFGCFAIIVMNLAVSSYATTEVVAEVTTQTAVYDVSSEEYAYEYGYGSDDIGNWTYAAANVSSINIDLVSADIVFVEGYGSNIAVSLYCDDIDNEMYLDVFKVDLMNGALHIIENDTIYDDVDFTFTVELPVYSLGSLDISNVSGDIDISSQIAANRLNVSSVSGDVLLNCTNCNDVTVCTTAGDIDIYELYSENLQLETISGAIYVYDSLYAQNVKVITTSGDFYGGGIYVSDLEMETVSGDFDIYSGLEFTLDYSTISGTIDDWGSNQNGEADFSFQSVSGNLTAQVQY